MQRKQAEKFFVHNDPLLRAKQLKAEREEERKKQKEEKEARMKRLEESTVRRKKEKISHSQKTKKGQHKLGGVAVNLLEKVQKMEAKK